MDDRVHPADAIRLTGEFPRLRPTAEVAEDDSRGVRGEASQRRRPLANAGVEDNVMALTHVDPGGGAADRRLRCVRGMSGAVRIRFRTTCPAADVGLVRAGTP
jgi:hypothetical protein